MVLHVAWLIDKHKDYKKVRKDIAAVKVAMPKVYHDIAANALHIHGALGVSNEMPFTGMVISSFVMGIADGPTEVHKVTVAKQLLKDFRPDNDLFPSYHLPKVRERGARKARRSGRGAQGGMGQPRAEHRRAVSRNCRRRPRSRHRSAGRGKVAWTPSIRPASLPLAMLCIARPGMTLIGQQT